MFVCVYVLGGVGWKEFKDNRRASSAKVDDRTGQDVTGEDRKLA